MTGPLRLRWSVALVTATVTFSLIATWPFFGGPLMDRFLVRRWSTQIDILPDDEASRLVERVAELGEPGIPLLVKALGNRRASVAQAAKSALRRQVERWRMMPKGDASQHVALAAHCLAQRANQFGATAQDEATDLAMQFLVWPLDGAEVDCAQIVADCERILLASATARRSNRNTISGSPLSKEDAAVRQRQSTPQHSGSIAAAGYLDSEVEVVPGGDLPFEMVEIPSLPPSLEQPLELIPPDPYEPDLLPPTIKAMPGLLFPESDQPLPMHAATIPTRRRARNAAQEPSMAEPNRRDRQEPINAEQLTGLSTREVMNYLHSFNASLSKAAQDELIRRGFDTYELGAARRLGSPEPEDRQALAEALSALPISPVRWLIWLSLDKDAHVRLSAVSLMATSTDPRLTNRLQEMRNTERDRRVNELLQRWSRNR